MPPLVRVEESCLSSVAVKGHGGKRRKTRKTSDEQGCGGRNTTGNSCIYGRLTDLLGR